MTALQNVWTRHQGLSSSSPIDNTRVASSDNSGGNPPSVEARATAQIAPHYEQLTQPAYSTAQLNRLSPLSAGVAKLCRRENLPNTVGAMLGVVALAGSVYAVSASQESATFQSLLDTLLGLFKPMSELSHDMADVMRDGQQVVDSVTGTLAHTPGAFASVMDTVNRALLPLLRTAIPVALGSSTMATSSASTIFKTLDQLIERAANDGELTFTEEAIETLKRLTGNNTELTQLLATLEGGVNHVTERISPHAHQLLEQTVDALEALPEDKISAMVSSAVNSLTHADRALAAGRTVLSESKPMLAHSKALLMNAEGVVNQSSALLPEVIQLLNTILTTFEQSESMLATLERATSTMESLVDAMGQFNVDQLPATLLPLSSVCRDLANQLLPLSQEAGALMQHSSALLQEIGTATKQEIPHLVEQGKTMLNQANDGVAGASGLFEQSAELTKKIEVMTPMILGLEQQGLPMLRAVKSVVERLPGTLDQSARLGDVLDDSTQQLKTTLSQSAALFATAETLSDGVVNSITHALDLALPMANLLGELDELGTVLGNLSNGIDLTLSAGGSALNRSSSMIEQAKLMLADASGFERQFSQLMQTTVDMVESAKGLIDHSDVALDDVIAIVNSLGGLFTALSDLTHAAKEVTDLNELDDIWEVPDHATIQTDFSGAIKEIELCEGDQGFDPLGVKAALCQVTQQIKDKIADSGVIDTVAEVVINESYNGIFAFLEKATEDLFDQTTDLSQAFAELDNVIDQPSQFLTGAGDDLTSIGSSLTAFSTQMSSLVTDLGLIKTAGSDLLGSVPTAGALDSTVGHIAELEVQFTALRNNLSPVFSLVAETNTYLNAIQPKVPLLHQQLTDLKNLIEQSELNDKTTALMQDIPHYEAMLTRLSDEMAGVRMMLDNWAAPLSMIDDALSALDEQLLSFDDGIASIGDTLETAKLSQSIDEMLNSLQSIARDMTQLSGSIAPIDGLLTTTGQRLESSAMSLGRLAVALNETITPSVTETVTDAANHLVLWGQSVQDPVTNIQSGLGRLAQHLDVTHSGLTDMRALLGGVGGQLKGLNSDAVGAIDHIAQTLESAKLTMRGFTETIDPIDSEMGSIANVLEQVAPGLEDFKAGMAALDRLMQDNPLPLFIDLLNQIKGDLSHTSNEGQVIGNALHELTASVEPMLADVAQLLNTIESLQTLLANSDVPELDYGNLSETLSGFNQQLLDLAQHQPAFLQSIESVVSLNSIVQNLNQQMLSSVQRYQDQGRAEMIASEQSLRSMSSHFATLGSDEVKETAHLLLVPIKIAVVTLCVVTTAYLGRQVTELLVNATSKTTTPSSQPHSDVEMGSGQMVVDMRRDGVSQHDLSDLGSVHDLDGVDDQV